MTYKQFPAFLNLVAIKKFPVKDENESFLKLFDAHLYPLYVLLYAKTNIGAIDQLIRDVTPFPILVIICMKQHELYDIYQKYFKDNYITESNQFSDKTVEIGKD